MKNTIFLFLLATTLSYGQIPVTDVAAGATLSTISMTLQQANMKHSQIKSKLGSIHKVDKQALDRIKKHLQEAKDQTEILQDSDKKLQNLIDKYDTSEKVQDYEMVRTNVQYHFAAVQLYSTLINKLAMTNLSDGALTKFDNKINNILEEMKGDKEFTLDLIKDDYYEMDDGKRLQLIRDANKMLKANYEKLIAFAEFVDKKIVKLDYIQG